MHRGFAIARQPKQARFTQVDQMASTGLTDEETPSVILGNEERMA
jgi:hypothetical protein